MAVTRDELEYYHSELEHRKHDPLGTIYLKNIGSVIPTERKKATEAFEFVVSSSTWVKKDISKRHREFYFAAPTEEERDEWITTIEFLKTIAVHRSFQSTFGTKLSIPLHFDDPVVNLFDRKLPLSTAQPAKATAGEKESKVLSTVQRRQTMKTLGLMLSGMQGQTSHKQEQDLKESIKGMFNYMFVHLAGHMMEHSFRAKDEYRRNLSQTPRIVEQNHVIEAIEARAPELAVGSVSPTSGSEVVSGIPSTVSVDRKRLNAALAFREGTGDQLLMAKIKEEKVEDDETSKSKTELTLVQRQSDRHESTSSAKESERAKKDSLPEARPEEEEEVKGVVDESVVDSEGEDPEKSVNASHPSVVMAKEPPIVRAHRERRSLAEGVTSPSHETVDENKSQSRSQSRQQLERKFSAGASQIIRKSILEARKFSLLTTSSVTQSRLMPPPAKTKEDLTAGTVKDATGTGDSAANLLTIQLKPKYDEPKETRWASFDPTDAQFQSQSNDIASVMRIDLRQRWKDNSSSIQMQQMRSARSLAKSGREEQKSLGKNKSEEAARIMAEVQRFVLRKFFPQSARMRKQSPSDYDTNTNKFGCTIRVSSVGTLGRDRIFDKSSSPRGEGRKEEDTLSLTEYRDLSQTAMDQMDASERDYGEPKPLDTVSPGEDPVPNQEENSPRESEKKYGFVVRAVQSLGGDIYELKENTLVTVEKVNEEDNIATCAYKGQVGLFPLDAIKIGSAVKNSSMIARGEEKRRKMSLSLREGEDSKIT